MAYSLSGLGNVAQAQGDILAARRYYEESLGLCRELGQRNGVAYVLVILGSVAESQSNYREAWSCYEESLTTTREIGNWAYMTTVLEAFAGLAAHTGKPEPAAVLWGAAEALREKIGSPTPHEREIYDHDVAEARRTLGEVAFSASWEMGRCMTLEQAIEYALKEPSCYE